MHMPTDYRALGRYAEAVEQLRYALKQRHYLTTTMSRLLLSAGGPDLEGSVVKSLDTEKIEEIAGELVELEQQINTWVRGANANATMSGKPLLRKAT